MMLLYESNGLSEIYLMDLPLGPILGSLSQ
jgi:hypothetical protein